MVLALGTWTGVLRLRSPGKFRKPRETDGVNELLMASVRNTSDDNHGFAVMELCQPFAGVRATVCG